MNELVNYDESEMWNLLRLAARREAGRLVTEEKMQRDGEEEETLGFSLRILYNS